MGVCVALGYGFLKGLKASGCIGLILGPLRLFQVHYLTPVGGSFSRTGIQRNRLPVIYWRLVQQRGQ